MMIGLDIGLVPKFNRDTFFNQRGQLLCIPVRQSHATMALGLVDKIGLGRAVNSIGRLRQVDPDRSDWAVWTRRNFKGLVVIPLLEVLVGIVCVGRVLDDSLYLMCARRRGIARSAYGCRIGGDHAVIVIRDEFPIGAVDDYAGYFLDDILARRRHYDLASGGCEIGIGIEEIQQALVHVKALGQHLLRPGVAEPLHLGHLGIVFGNLFDVSL